MRQYQDFLKKILTDKYSVHKPSRSGVDMISRFGYQMEFDLQEGFPLVTTKKLHYKSMIHELIWFLKGSTNIQYLNENNIHIWDLWANKEGELGAIYGYQWRNWEKFTLTKEGYKKEYIDQIKKVIKDIKTDPFSKRHIINAWNVADLEKMALPPCHVLYQFDVTKEGIIDCEVYQRAGDAALGVPFNIASASLLTHLIAKETNLTPGRLIHSFGSAHIYCGKGERGQFYADNLDELKEKVKAAKKPENYLKIKDWIEANAPAEHFNEAKERKTVYDHVPKLLEQLARDPLPLPKLEINSTASVDYLTYEDIKIVGYQHHPSMIHDH
ncbi:thymidylate synthase [Candidatus Pacearchaeota archaeon]|nr:thymidylate synthase [Candidatus Pacearchaeota archaeon]